MLLLRELVIFLSNAKERVRLLYYLDYHRNFTLLIIIKLN